MATRTLRIVLALGVAIFTIWFCAYPLVTSLYYIFFDAGLKGEGASRYAIRLHRNIAARYEDYARERIASGKATKLGVHQVAETEWPVYGSMFFLNASEALQDEWLRDRSRFPGEPAKYARGAIDGARDILLDPGHATWVRNYWGERYLEEENCFYRFLVISGLSSHYRLTGDTHDLPFLRMQTELLAEQIDRSPHGLIDDYPGQCFPCDVGAALGAIQQADAVLGTDHRAVLKRAARAFRKPGTDKLPLPPYMAAPETGLPTAPSRGCTNGFLGSYVPRLWPELAPSYYAALEREFWQANWFTAGFREFPRGTGRDWTFDVDAGPVAGGLGTSASGLGIGAARAHGRFDHARALSTEMIACSWQLPNGTNLVPSFVSHREHAPYFADLVNLFNLTRTPVPGSTAIVGGHPPCVVWFILLIEAFVSFILLRLAWRIGRKKA